MDKSSLSNGDSRYVRTSIKLLFEQEEPYMYIHMEKLKEHLNLFNAMCSWINQNFPMMIVGMYEKVQAGKDQEKARLERDSHSKNRGGKKTN